MSREERRQYQRMMRNMERGPALPRSVRSRAERSAARRGGRREQPAGGPRFTGRFFFVATTVAFAVGLIAFSVQWPEMPFALYVGLAVAAVAFGVQVGMRLLQRRRWNARSTGGS